MGDLIFGIVFIYSTVNSVNFTDGVDGLCGSVTVTAVISIGVIAAMKGLFGFSMAAAALAGACIGFVLWNKNPAKVFMGDTGSLALGGLLGTLAILGRCELLLAIFGGVLLEEVTFRGLILPTLYRKLKGKKHDAFLSVLYSSLLFGGAHIVNLLITGNIGAVVMQMGYSFLIGGMCAIAFIKTGCFYNAIILHFIFNFGGMLFNYKMISGTIWDLATIIVTAVLAILVIIYAIYILLRGSNSQFNEKVIVESHNHNNS